MEGVGENLFPKVRTILGPGSQFLNVFFKKLNSSIKTKEKFLAMAL